MSSGNKLNEALQMILDNLNETNCTDVDIEAMEAENEQLRQKKTELLARLNHHSTVNNSIILVKDMLSRQQTLNRTRTESKEQATVRSKNRLTEAAAQVASWKQKLQEVDNFMTLPHNEVLKKVLEMEKKIAENRSNINKLSQEYEKLSLKHREGTDDILKLNETLRCIEEDQRKLLETLREGIDVTAENTQLQGFDDA